MNPKLVIFFLFFLCSLSLSCFGQQRDIYPANSNSEKIRVNPDFLSQNLASDTSEVSNKANLQNMIRGDVAATIQNQQIMEAKEIANLRTGKNGQITTSFCTIFAFSFHWWYIKITSYQDADNSNCPYEQFIKLTAGSIMQQMRTLEDRPFIVRKGGVNFRTMDARISGSEGRYQFIGNIKMHPESEIRISLLDLILKPRLLQLTNLFGGTYQEIAARESTYNRWDPGSIIRYIETKDGQTYVMTSFNSQIYPTLTMKDLDNLGQYLSLPPGWQFKTKTLDKVLEYRSGQSFNNYRMIDQFNNYYLKINLDNLN